MTDKRKIKSISIPQKVYDKSKLIAKSEEKSWSQMVVDLLVKKIKNYKGDL